MRMLCYGDSNTYEEFLEEYDISEADVTTEY